MNYSEPMTYEQIKRKGEQWCRTTYNNIIATRNLVNIQQVHASDLDITDTENFTYLLTYSFPCQDLSLAGKGKGMTKGSGTRSGLLWEVERILDECNKLPQVLIMENVPQVVGTNSIKDFQDWVTKLESLGYSNFVEILNAKDYGIPQNRERCFMVSILGDYTYKMPKKRTLKYRLKDLLENEVDEKYYLSQQMIEGMMNTNFESYKLENKLLDLNGTANCIIARFEGTPQCIKVGNYSPSGHNASSIVSGDGIAPTVMENHGTVTAVIEEPQVINPLKDKTLYGWHFEQQVYDENGITRTIKAGDGSGNIPKVINDLRIRKLTPKECWRLMGVKDNDFENVSKNQSNSSLYHLAGDSICTVCLLGLFGELLGIDYQTKIDELTNELKQE
jgi:DNA (cytosine-5)-methyltransferase 1